MVLSMLGEKVGYKKKKKHNQRQTHLGDSRVIMTLNYVSGAGRGERGTRYNSQEAQGSLATKVVEGKAAGGRAAQPLGWRSLV